MLRALESGAQGPPGCLGQPGSLAELQEVDRGWGLGASECTLVTQQEPQEHFVLRGDEGRTLNPRTIYPVWPRLLALCPHSARLCPVPKPLVSLSKAGISSPCLSQAEGGAVTYRVMEVGKSFS